MANLWNNNRVQFARLLAEINAVGLTNQQKTDLCNSMDLTREEVQEIFDRAEKEFEAIKVKG